MDFFGFGLEGGDMWRIGCVLLIIEMYLNEKFLDGIC